MSSVLIGSSTCMVGSNSGRITENRLGVVVTRFSTIIADRRDVPDPAALADGAEVTQLLRREIAKVRTRPIDAFVAEDHLAQADRVASTAYRPPSLSRGTFQSGSAHCP